MPVFRPGKPYSIRRITAAPANHAALGDIAWDTEDSDGEFGPGTTMTSLEVAVAGLYSITAGWARNNAAASASINLVLVVAGVSVRGGRSDATTGFRQLSLSYMAQLAVGATIKCQALFALGTEVNQPMCGLEVVRVGPVRWT